MDLRMKLAVGGVMAAVATIAVAGMAAASELHAVVAKANALSPQARPTDAFSCDSGWTDGATFGITCRSNGSGFRFQAYAQCQNGQTVYGAPADNGGRSYAYCSSVGSTYRPGTGGGQPV